MANAVVAVKGNKTVEGVELSAKAVKALATFNKAKQAEGEKKRERERNRSQERDLATEECERGRRFSLEVGFLFRVGFRVLEFFDDDDDDDKDDDEKETESKGGSFVFGAGDAKERRGSFSGREARERGVFLCLFLSAGSRPPLHFLSRGAFSCFLVDLARAKGHTGRAGKARVAQMRR